MKRIIHIFTALAAALAAAAGCSASSVEGGDILVEAEHFDSFGGWFLDEQFYDQVGSAYLLAHGAGIPVDDAVTSVEVPSSGRYGVWVRTFNWNAPWDTLQAPGLFQLLVDGKPVCPQLGDSPSEWGWKYAGKVRLKKGCTQLALHDLTGFEGRCDAVWISAAGTPPPAERSLASVDAPEEYDLIVTGAGSAGISAAVAAARSGLKVLLLDDKDHAGGNSSPENRITISGRAHEGRYPNLGRVICEYGRAYDDYDAFKAKLDGEENLTVLMSHRVVGVRMDGNRISAVEAVDFKGRRSVLFRAKLFADCTGDGNLGYLAGAEYMTGQETRDVYGETLAPEEPEKRSYGSTVKWYAEKTDSVPTFPATPWAVRFTDETARPVMGFKWFWEVGFGRDQIADAEWMRDYMFRVIYGNWSHLKNSPAFSAQFANAALTPGGVSMLLGKRESRRLRGDVVFNQNDCYGDWKRFPDAAVWATYPIDQHFPKAELTAIMPGEEFEAINKHNFCELGRHHRTLVAGKDYQYPYMIPYRCLYSVNVENMFMAGRNISGSRIALCSYRVAGTCALMGEVVGLAAVICNGTGCTPREVYSAHLPQLLSSLKSGVPARYDEIYRPD